MKYVDKLLKHKGKIATAAAEGSVAHYIMQLRNVVTEPFVKYGLDRGEVLTTPVKIVVYPRSIPDFFTGNWAGLVQTTTGQSVPTYAKNLPVANLLNASQNPVAVAGALAAPLAIYCSYRLAKVASPTAEKNMERLSETVLPEFAHEKFKGLYNGIKRKVNGDYNEK